MENEEIKCTACDGKGWLPHTPSPVEGEKEEPREREFRITKNYEDGTSEVTCLRINGEKWVKESDQASRIKELEDELAFEIRVANAQTEIAKELAQEKEALEERLNKVTKIIDHELAEIPKLQDFASKHGDAQGYARICGQEIILETLKQKFDKLKH